MSSIGLVLFLFETNSLVLVISINFIMLEFLGQNHLVKFRFLDVKKKIFLPVLQNQVVGTLKGQKPVN